MANARVVISTSIIWLPTSTVLTFCTIFWFLYRSRVFCRPASPDLLQDNCSSKQTTVVKCQQKARGQHLAITFNAHTSTTLLLNSRKFMEWWWNLANDTYSLHVCKLSDALWVSGWVLGAFLQQPEPILELIFRNLGLLARKIPGATGTPGWVYSNDQWEWIKPDG